MSTSGVVSPLHRRSLQPAQQIIIDTIRPHHATPKGDGVMPGRQPFLKIRNGQTASGDHGRALPEGSEKTRPVAASQGCGRKELHQTATATDGLHHLRWAEDAWHKKDPALTGLIQKHWTYRATWRNSDKLSQDVESSLLDNGRCTNHKLRAGVGQASDEFRPTRIVPPGHFHMHEPDVLKDPQLINQ